MWEVMLNQRLIFGRDKVGEVAGIFKFHRCRKILIVVSNKNAAILEKVMSGLDEMNLGYCIYNKVRGEPDLNVVDEGADLLKKEGCDGVLGIGGGSVLDTAKAIALLGTNEGKIEEYQMGRRQAARSALPLIAVPTTFGSGSEATKTSVLYNNNNGLKKSVYHPSMIAGVVVLDPAIAMTLPRPLMASTGMDALSHAIESYVGLNANVLTEMYSIKAMKLIGRSFVRAVSDAQDTQAHEDMVLASYLAGCALNAGIGIAHIVAQPLGGMYKIPHGEACSIFLPLSMEINSEYSLLKYAEIAEILGGSNRESDQAATARNGVETVRAIRKQVGAADRLKPFIKDQPFHMDEILDNIRQSTGHIKNNPRAVDEKLLIEIIQKAI